MASPPGLTDVSEPRPDQSSLRHYPEFSLGRFLYPRGRNEDCIAVHAIRAAGHEPTIVPIIVIADGASSAGDAVAPQTVVSEVVSHLSADLPKVTSLTRVLSSLEESFQHATRRLAGSAGATTLLIALLWQQPPRPDLSRTNRHYWCYAYEGDGAITLVSPSRRIKTIALQSRLAIPLLTPQQVGETACLSSEGAAVPPFVGCTLHQPGDVVYAASDGMGRAEAHLLKWEPDPSTLDDFILRHRQDQNIIHEALAACPFRDDAALGIIWTGRSS